MVRIWISSQRLYPLRIIKKADEKKFIRVLYYRNLRMNYELLGNREIVEKIYLEGIQIVEKLGLNKALIDAIFKDYNIK